MPQVDGEVHTIRKQAVGGDLYKKYLYQGHEFDRQAMKAELGDVLWYCAELAAGLGITLEEVAEGNIAKLQKRYPDGFDARRSVERSDQ